MVMDDPQGKQMTLETGSPAQALWTHVSLKLILFQTKAEPHYHYLMSV